MIARTTLNPTRRGFLRALAAGTGAVLLGRQWYRQGSGLLVPDDGRLVELGFWTVSFGTIPSLRYQRELERSFAAALALEADRTFSKISRDASRTFSMHTGASGPIVSTTVPKGGSTKMSR